MVSAIKSLYIFLALFLSASLLAVEAGTAQEICDLVNEQRAKVGAHPLVLDARLMRVSELHNQYCIDNNILTHDDPAGTLGDRFSQQGYDFSCAGENIAQGFADNDAQGVMNAWMNSPGHRANILNHSFRHIGFSCGSGYFTQDFGNTLNGDVKPYNDGPSNQPQPTTNNKPQSTETTKPKKKTKVVKKFGHRTDGKVPCEKKN